MARGRPAWVVGQLVSPDTLGEFGVVLMVGGSTHNVPPWNGPVCGPLVP